MKRKTPTTKNRAILKTEAAPAPATAGEPDGFVTVRALQPIYRPERLIEPGETFICLRSEAARLAVAILP